MPSSGGFPQQQPGGFPSFPQPSGFPSMSPASSTSQFPSMPSFPSFPSQPSFAMPSFGQSLPQASNQPVSTSQAQPIMMPQQMPSFATGNFQATMANPLPFMPDNSYSSMPMMGMPNMSSSFPSAGFQPASMPTQAPADFSRTQSTPSTQVPSNGMPVCTLWCIIYTHKAHIFTHTYKASSIPFILSIFQVNADSDDFVPPLLACIKLFLALRTVPPLLTSIAPLMYSCSGPTLCHLRTSSRKSCPPWATPKVSPPNLVSQAWVCPKDSPWAAWDSLQEASLAWVVSLLASLAWADSLLASHRRLSP
jgi:hypothetical protein